MAKLSPVALRGAGTAMRMQARSDRDWTGARRIMTKLPRTPELDAAMTTFFQASALLDQIRLRIWDRENLTVTQLRLLGHLRDREGLSNAELADLLYVTRPSVSALLERLERGGVIRREVWPNDRRGLNIWPRPRGGGGAGEPARGTAARYSSRRARTAATWPRPPRTCARKRGSTWRP